MPYHPFFKFLDTVGDGTGTKIAIGDYSGGMDFKFVHPAAAVNDTEVHRLMIHIEDTSPFSANQYGGLSELTNGIQLLQCDENGATFRDLTDGLPIKSNAHWGRFCFDFSLDAFGSGGDFVQARWTFKNAGRPLFLKPGWSFIARITDNLTGLIDHTFNLQGIYK